uniref:Transmembrane protein n=1 Tax=Trypanosoma congolense (strain IL3000) TaxID=1068625 RepID=G0UR74_TRYCI|nr:hypothetical protein, unlikely [Trypanosoma congolense IL3000]
MSSPSPTTTDKYNVFAHSSDYNTACFLPASLHLVAWTSSFARRRSRKGGKTRKEKRKKEKGLTPERASLPSPHNNGARFTQQLCSSKQKKKIMFFSFLFLLYAIVSCGPTPLSGSRLQNQMIY